MKLVSMRQNSCILLFMKNTYQSTTKTTCQHFISVVLTWLNSLCEADEEEWPCRRSDRVHPELPLLSFESSTAESVALAPCLDGKWPAYISLAFSHSSPESVDSSPMQSRMIFWPSAHKVWILQEALSDTDTLPLLPVVWSTMLSSNPAGVHLRKSSVPSAQGSQTGSDSCARYEEVIT